MAENSKIEWTNHTFNPWIGCTKVSPGCANCYAAEQNKLRKWVGDGRWNGPRRRTSLDNWRQPLRWNAAAAKSGTRPRVFCASLADWLDDQVPAEWLADLLNLIRQTPNLDWLLLTKRPENWRQRMFSAQQCGNADVRHMIAVWPAPNVWIGTTVENQEYAARRIPELLTIPARVRFLSVEPMLSPLLSLPLSGIHWVICGGESGPNFRPFAVQWAETLALQCEAAGVPFFMKQDSGARSGMQGRIPPELWSRKEIPAASGKESR